ncbi:MAG: aminotransferase class I/II-fold pyridoxal phosphate-dependent enzyme [Oscillospiraceae bacterium]
MYTFINDYSEGAHERIIDALVKTNRNQTCGYGMDEYCAEARELIKKKLNNDDSIIHFLVGGTQTNMTVIAALLRAHQGVISAVSGHINVHETGAVEATGHKVLTIPTDNGKITAEQVNRLISAHYADSSAEHTVQPGMVYISNPTEVGTIYSVSELTELKKVCEKYEIPLFLDGARLGCALASESNDLNWNDLTRLTDVFYIGGTKMGALFGEALIFNSPALEKDFRYFIKQRGGMLAKGRMLGIQFAELFRDDLYLELAAHADRLAKKLTDAVRAMGYAFFSDSPTNQVFPILPKSVIEALRENYGFEFWQNIDETHDAIRLVTSWATDETNVDEFTDTLARLTKENIR